MSKRHLTKLIDIEWYYEDKKYDFKCLPPGYNIFHYFKRESEYEWEVRQENSRLGHRFTDG